MSKTLEDLMAELRAMPSGRQAAASAVRELEALTTPILARFEPEMAVLIISEVVLQALNKSAQAAKAPVYNVFTAALGTQALGIHQALENARKKEGRPAGSAMADGVAMFGDALSCYLNLASRTGAAR